MAFGFLKKLFGVEEDPEEKAVAAGKSVDLATTIAALKLIPPAIGYNETDYHLVANMLVLRREIVDAMTHAGSYNGIDNYREIIEGLEFFNFALDRKTNLQTLGSSLRTLQELFVHLDEQFKPKTQRLIDSLKGFLVSDPTYFDRTVKKTHDALLAQARVASELK